MKYPKLETAAKTFISRAKGITEGKSWIVKAWNSDHPSITSLLGRTDRTISKMTERDALLINGKFNDIIPNKAEKFLPEYDEQFRNALVEILGWGWLTNKHPSLNVEFCSLPDEQGIRSPDLCAWDEGRVLSASLECKHLGVSIEEKNWIQSGEIKSGPITYTATLEDPKQNPFLNKLQSTIATAKTQIETTGLTENKYIFVNISLDTPNWGITSIMEGIRELIGMEATRLAASGIELVAFEHYDPDNSLLS